MGAPAPRRSRGWGGVVEEGGHQHPVAEGVAEAEAGRRSTHREEGEEEVVVGERLPMKAVEGGAGQEERWAMAKVGPAAHSKKAAAAAELAGVEPGFCSGEREADVSSVEEPGVGPAVRLRAELWEAMQALGEL